MSERITLHSPNISCNHCAMTIKRELASVEGLGSVEVDVPAKQIDLEYADDAALAWAKATLDQIGYPVADE